MATSRKPSGRTKKAATDHGTPAATRVVRRRLWSIAALWLFIVVFLVGPALLGNLLFVVPAIGFAIAAVATMRLARSPHGPDAEVLAPGALKAATRAEPVEVQRAPRLGHLGGLRRL